MTSAIGAHSATVYDLGEFLAQGSPSAAGQLAAVRIADGTDRWRVAGCAGV